MTAASRLALFIGLCCACAIAVAVYLRRAGGGRGEAPAAIGADPAAATALAGTGRIFYRHTGLDSAYSRLVLADFSASPPAFQISPLACERVHFAGAHGVCLTAERRMLTTYKALLLDADLQVRRTLPLTGIPSRARVSPDGRLAAFTVFESGHSYASAAFSTRTSIVDLESGDFRIANLETLRVLHDGSERSAVDFNFWGVTFARSSNRFFATLGTGNHLYLIEGDVDRGEARILRDGVECPSLSPDNTRLAFKKRKGDKLGPITWRIAVLDLGSGAEVELAETRSVDDQVDWLDDRTILYALPEQASGSAVHDTWMVAADGSGAPRLVQAKAHSLGLWRA